MGGSKMKNKIRYFYLRQLQETSIMILFNVNYKPFIMFPDGRNFVYDYEEFYVRYKKRNN